MVAAIKFGYEEGIKPILEMQRELMEKAGTGEELVGDLLLQTPVRLLGVGVTLVLAVEPGELHRIVKVQLHVAPRPKILRAYLIAPPRRSQPPIPATPFLMPGSLRR